MLSRPSPPQFDLVYIDGSHRAADVLSDAVLAWKLLSRGGIMIFDDYEWHEEATREAIACPRIAVDAFVQCHSDSLHVLHQGYQLFVRKDVA
eukprot:JP439750.1.p1 GENE.JP439750.1~~JP439750.1.p1  ORF type:complete len:92 (-),score=10.09 JP439750.1:105-380(-)